MLLPLNTVGFWSRIKIGEPDQCWPWTGAKRRGYGVYEGISTHRIAYTLAKGPIPPGLMIRHTCDNRPCCNPAHLLTGTNADNHRDACERQRWRMGISNGNAKLTDEQISFIRNNLTRRGVDLASELGVAQSTVSMVRTGKRRTTAPPQTKD